MAESNTARIASGSGPVDPPERGVRAATRLAPISRPAILHVRIDDFAAVVAMQARPELAGRALIVGSDALGRGEVLAVSPAARAEGVLPGMRLAAAEKLCPTAMSRPLDPRGTLAAARRVLDALGAYTPLVEPEWLIQARKGGRAATEDLPRLARCLGAVLDVHGCERLFGSAAVIAERLAGDLAERGYAPRIGIAGTPALAAVASTLAGPKAPVEIPIGEERAFLETVPLAILEGLDGDLRDYLRALGIVRAGQVARLPPAALRRRFGQAGREASEQALGKANRLVIAPTAPPTLEAARELDDPTGDGLYLERELGRLAARLARNLEARGQSASRITLTITCEGGRSDGSGGSDRSVRSRPSRPSAHHARVLHLKQPVAGAPALLARARELLAQIAPDRPVSALRIELAALGPAPVQLSFSIATGIRAPSGEKVDTVARKLRDRFGPGAARHAHLVANAILPEDQVAWDDQEHLPARPARPLAVRVNSGGQPTAVRRGNGPWEPVRAIYSQWRLRSHWWSEPTHRHYYRLETASGAILDIYHEQEDGRWRLVATRD